MGTGWLRLPLVNLDPLCGVLSAHSLLCRIHVFGPHRNPSLNLITTELFNLNCIDEEEWGGGGVSRTSLSLLPARHRWYFFINVSGSFFLHWWIDSKDGLTLFQITEAAKKRGQGWRGTAEPLKYNKNKYSGLNPALLYSVCLLHVALHKEMSAEMIFLSCVRLTKVQEWWE